MILAQQMPVKKEARIWAASYDSKKDAFRVAMEDGSIFLLRRPIPDDDQSEVLDVYLEGDGEIFTVIQSNGNEFSVPWDVIGNLAEGRSRKPEPGTGKRIGKRVRSLRKVRGLTQEQLARMSGVKRPNISRLEAGTHMPGIALIERLARSLNVSISDLVSIDNS